MRAAGVWTRGHIDCLAMHQSNIASGGPAGSCDVYVLGADYMPVREFRREICIKSEELDFHLFCELISFLVCYFPFALFG